MNVYKGIIQGLNEAVEYEKGVGKARVHKRMIKPVEDFAPEEIKAIRQSFDLSQATFATVMGVSVKTVEAWESGTNIPSGSSRRLMSMLRTDPQILKRCNILA